MGNQTTYTQSRLAELGISADENTCHSFKTFDSYYLFHLNSELYGKSKRERERLYAFASPYDNILISYSTIWGRVLSYTPKGNQWDVATQRIRYHEKNRFENPNQITGKVDKLPKYRSSKNSENKPFFNGIYAYFVKPLLAQGKEKEEILSLLKPIFKKVIITEGEFKAFAGCKLGMPVIGISGIHNAVKTIKQTIVKNTLTKYEITVGADLLPDLLEFIRLFEVAEINFLLDGDTFDNQSKPSRAKSFFAAIKNCWTATRKEGIKLTFSFIKPNAPGKGLDDIIGQCLDKSDVLSWIENIPLDNVTSLEKLQFTFATSVQGRPSFFSKSYELVKAEKGTKLANFLQPEWMNDSLLIAPTGSGKTYLVAKCKGWKIIVCPTTSLCENVAAEYNALHFEGSKVKQFEEIVKYFEVIDLVCQLIKFSRGTPIKFIAVTYKSFRKLTAYLTRLTQTFKVFIDEAHNYTTAASSGYMLQELSELVDLCQHYKSTTLLTGTHLPCFHPAITKMPIKEVSIPKPTVNAGLFECKDVLRGASLLIKQSIQAARFPLVLFNSKKKEGRLGTLQTYLKNFHIAYFNADTKMDAGWQKITKQGIIDQKYQGMCVTSVLKEGNNIYNKYDFDIIIIGNFHSAEIEQFLNRPRKAKSLTVSKLVGEKREKGTTVKSIYSIATYLLYKAMATCTALNAQDEISFNAIEKEFIARQAIAAQPIVFSNIEGVFKIDWLKLSNYAFEFDKWQESRNDDLLAGRLKQYNIALMPCRLLGASEKTEEEKKHIQATKKATRKEKDIAFDGLYQTLQHKEIFTYAMHSLSNRAKQLTPVQKQVFENIQSVSQLIMDKAKVMEMLEDARLSTARFRLLKRQYIVQCLLDSSEYMASRRSFAQIIHHIRITFKEGDQLAGNQIKELLLPILRIDEGIDLSKIKADQTNKRIINVLRMFFDLENKRTKNGYLYTIRCTKWVNNIINQPHLVHLSAFITETGQPQFWKGCFL